MNKITFQWTIKQIDNLKSFLKKYDLQIVNNEQLFNFQQAFTHPSYAYENKLEYNYQKLEFLGDALLQKEISFYLFNKHNLNEGDMTLDRTKMVCHASLSQMAKNLNFERFILVGLSYNSKNISDKNYEDIFEAFCAALFLSFGEESLISFLQKTLIFYFENNLLVDNVNYKSKFQEIMQRFGKNDIRYITREIKEGPNHHFFTKVVCDGISYGEGEGVRKHDSENLAAKNALQKCVQFEK